MDKKILKPLRGYVLLKLIEKEEETTSQGLVITEPGEKRQAKGQILAVGEPPYLATGFVLEWEVEIGDIIWFKRFGGEEIKERGEKFLFVPYGEIIGVYK